MTNEELQQALLEEQEENRRLNSSLSQLRRRFALSRNLNRKLREDLEKKRAEMIGWKRRACELQVNQSVLDDQHRIDEITIRSQDRQIAELRAERDRQSEILRILKKYLLLLTNYEPSRYDYVGIGANDEGELLSKQYTPKEYEAIKTWLEE